jgi:hypothetical protein
MNAVINMLVDIWQRKNPALFDSGGLFSLRIGKKIREHPVFIIKNNQGKK